MTSPRIPCVPLGQSGFRFSFGEVVAYVDPYLSNSVAEAEGPELNRLVPIWREPGSIHDAQWVLITHEHMDHCDVRTLVPLSHASPGCQFMGPVEVLEILAGAGIQRARLRLASREWITISADLRVHPVLAAHPDIEIRADAPSRYVGYVMEYRGRRIYHAGDTLLNTAVLDDVRAQRPLHVALIPVNERNFAREQRGIIGNMSVRDAFEFASRLGVETLVPIHWDMFEPNTVYRDELELYAARTRPAYRMLLNPTEL